MALVFLTVYLSSFGIGAGRAGLAVSAYGLGGLIAAPVAGYCCERLNPLTVMKASLFSQGIILLLFPFAGGFESLLALTLVWALAGEAFRPASSTLIGNLPDEEQRRLSFALNRTAVNIGMAIGPVLGGLLIHTSPAFVFIANSAASIAAGAFLTVSLRGRRFVRAARADGCRGGRSDSEMDAPGVRSLLLFLFALMPAFVAFYQYRSAMPQYFVERRILEPYFFSLLLLINTLLVIAFQAPLAVYLRRCPDLLGMSLGAFLVGAGFGGFAFATTFLGAAACVVVWTFGQMILFTGSDLYVSKVTGNEGRYVGLYHLTMNLAAFIGPGLGSAVLEYSAPTLWGVTFVWGCLSAIMFLRLPKWP